MMQVMDIRHIGNAQSTQEGYRLLLLESVVCVSLFGLCIALQDHHHFEHGDCSI
jgi:hypothetical protein